MACASYCPEVAELGEPQLRGPQQERWLRWLASERDNLRAALAWCRRGVSAVGPAELQAGHVAQPAPVDRAVAIADAWDANPGVVGPGCSRHQLVPMMNSPRERFRQPSGFSHQDRSRPSSRCGRVGYLRMSSMPVPHPVEFRPRAVELARTGHAPVAVRSLPVVCGRADEGWDWTRSVG